MARLRQFGFERTFSLARVQLLVLLAAGLLGLVQSASSQIDHMELAE